MTNAGAAVDRRFARRCAAHGGPRGTPARHAHDACLCAPPGFEELIRGLGLGLDYFPVGHDLRLGPRKVEGGPSATVAGQFAVLREAAVGCDAIVGCAAMQIATARSPK